MSGVTFDSGALIAIERRDQPFIQRLERMHQVGIKITVPAVVVAEWWRGGSTRLWNHYMSSFVIEPTAVVLARLAGEAMAAISKATTIDALVMASAALRGDAVYTSDFDDLTRLQQFFRSVRVLRVAGSQEPTKTPKRKR
jgi:predicted nucleic acid-binding protein